jgi:hypothetical protein
MSLQNKSFDSAVEDNYLHPVISLDARHGLFELRDIRGAANMFKGASA